MRRKINEIARFTKQPRALAEFYAGILAKAALRRDSETFSFDVDGVNLFIHPRGDATPPPGWPENVDHIALEVENLDAECARLAAAGYAIMGPNQYPWGRSAYLYDPDGRMVELHGPDNDGSPDKK